MADGARPADLAEASEASYLQVHAEEIAAAARRIAPHVSRTSTVPGAWAGVTAVSCVSLMNVVCAAAPRYTCVPAPSTCGSCDGW